VGRGERSLGVKQLFRIIEFGLDGMLVKRPVLVAGNRVLIGVREAEWQKALL